MQKTFLTIPWQIFPNGDYKLNLLPGISKFLKTNWSKDHFTFSTKCNEYKEICKWRFCTV